MAPERSCKATNADGDPCQSPANMVNDRGWCPAHDPEREAERRAAGRKGGRALKRKYGGGGLDPDDLPALNSPQAAEKWLEATGRAVATGKLGHNEGRTVVRAVREFIRAHDAGKVSERLDALMTALDRWRETGDPEPVLELVEGGAE